MASKKNNEFAAVQGSDKRLRSKDWRIDHLYKVVDINGHLVRFRRNRAQREFAKNKHTRNIILKSRRLGFTTDEAIDSLDDSLFVPNSNNLILSYDIPSQLDIFDNKVTKAWENMNLDLQALWALDADRSNKLKFNWGDGGSSSIEVRSKGRSGTFNRVHVSEFARICKISVSDAKEILSGTIQAVPMGGRVDIESTAEGDDGLFFDMFWEAFNRGEPQTPVDYKAHFFNWTYDDAELKKISIMDPLSLPVVFRRYQEEMDLTDREITYYYLKWLTLNKDWDLLHQEYPTTPEEAFTNSGIALFSGEKLALMKMRAGEKVGDWTYFSDYRPGHRYGLGADPSEGVGRDNATIAIVDFDASVDMGGVQVKKAEVVAIYSSDRIAPDTFAYEIKNGATRYGNCIAAVERNNHGYATIVALKGMYANIYKEVKLDESTDRETDRLGFHATAGMNAKIEYDLATAINEGEFNCPDIETVQELKTYPKDAGVRSRDPSGKHWDRAKAVMIAFHMRGYAQGTRVSTTSSSDALDPFDPLPQM